MLHCFNISGRSAFPGFSHTLPLCWVRAASSHVREKTRTWRAGHLPGASSWACGGAQGKRVPPGGLLCLPFLEAAWGWPWGCSLLGCRGQARPHLSRTGVTLISSMQRRFFTFNNISEIKTPWHLITFSWHFCPFLMVCAVTMCLAVASILNSWHEIVMYSETCFPLRP